MRYVANIRVLIEADSEAAACDLLSETFRPMLAEFGGIDGWIDWGYIAPNNPAEATPTDLNFFEYR